VEVDTTNQYLRIARPAVVLRFRGAPMISGGNQGAIDDPRPPAIPDHRTLEQGGQARRHVRDDAMRLGFRDREHGSQLANGQVGPKRDTCDEHASLEGLRPTMTSPLLGCSKSCDDVVELVER
jgi:hypothetical protein